MNTSQYIFTHSSLPKKGILNTLKLLEEDASIPFISRYRKEATGNLDEVQIAEIAKLKLAFEVLEKRKQAILKSIQEQEKLNSELKKRIEAAPDLTSLEDLYLPFKRKRKTRADIARENGLEPLAKLIMAQNTTNLRNSASGFVGKKVLSADEALAGAKDIVAEWINENEKVRNKLRRFLQKTARISSNVIKKKSEEEAAQKFKNYFDWEENLSRIPSHRLLAILRAEKTGFVRSKIVVENTTAIALIEKSILRKSQSAASSILQEAIQDSWKRLLFPALSNEILAAAKSKADEEAIQVFAENLRQLLLAPPLGGKRILAIDPGFKSGCKIVCLDKSGNLLHNETVYPHPPQRESVMSQKKIKSLVNAYQIAAISIGNGTASRETEFLIKKIKFDRDVQVFVVNEAGASVYSASKIAREEFPNYDVTVRGAVSIGRRLADPLAELVKIDPKAIGVGQYQHDVDQTKLKIELDRVVESCVNAVGINVNTASAALLSYVSGIGNSLAENIINFRRENGLFQSRAELLKVRGLGAKAFEQAAGFLRISKGVNPLDNSAVHPESYAIVEKMGSDLSVNVSELIGNTALLKKIRLEKYISGNVALPTLNDIISELEKPGLDPRKTAKVFEFDPTIKSIKDLKSGLKVPGIVNNITNFGCFVDIGIKESGLVHISKIAPEFVSDINKVVKLHQQVMVKIMEVDETKGRIQLSMID